MDIRWTISEITTVSQITMLMPTAAAAFFQRVMGSRMKYSCGLWTDSVQTLDAAEEAMLAEICRRAGITRKPQRPGLATWIGTAMRSFPF